MVKELGPLATLVKEIDGVKKQVEKSIKDSNKVLGNSKTKNDEEKLKEQFKICYDLNTNLAEYHEKVEALEEEKEPSKVKGFDNKKKAEITRIEKWQGQLDAQLKKILPGEKGEEYTKELKGEEEEEEDDDDEEEEEEEDDEEYEDEEEEEEEGTTQLEETGMSEAKDTLAETAKTEEDEEEYEEEDDEEEEEEEEEEEDVKKELISKEEKKDEKEKDKNKEKDKKVEKEKQNKVEKEKDKKKEKEKEKDKKKEKEKDKKKEKEKEVKVEKEKDKKEKDKKEKDKKGKKKVEEEIEEEEEEDEEEDEDEYEDDEEEDDDEEEEEEEEEEEDDEEEQKGKDSGRKKKKDDLEVTKVDEKPLFEALYDYSGEEEGDLTITKGEILTIVETRDDGWWMAENEKGEKGVVPKTYLKMYNKYKDVQQEDGEDEDEEEDDEDEEDKEDEEEDEDEEEKPKKKKGGKKLWGSIKKAVGEEDDNVKEEDETSVTDVLHALGAVPSGFRPSTLGPKFDKDEKYTMQNYLTPNLSKSNMFYKDLFYDPAQNKIRASPTKLDRIITLQNFKQIPLPGQGIEVMGRQVRVCLFDGQNILSNVHTIKVASVDKEQRAWSFSNKVSDNMDPFSHAEFFIRGNNTDDSIGILLELCVLYKRTSTEEQGEFSCGWTHIPLVEPTRNIVQNRQFDLHVNGGTPYEKGVEVDPSISRRTTSSAFMSLMSGNKQPRVSVKVAVPKLEQKNLMELLPETIVGNACLLPFYSYHRQILADTLLRDRIDLDSTELIHNPEMCTFPKVADQHDMMKLLRDHWIESSKSLKRVEMRDVEHMKNVFKTVVMETVYPLVHSSNLPKYNTSDRNSLIERQEEINKFKKGRTDKKSTLALLLSADMDFTPFDMSEVAFDVIGPHCLEVNSESTVEKKDTR